MTTDLERFIKYLSKHHPELYKKFQGNIIADEKQNIYVNKSSAHSDKDYKEINSIIEKGDYLFEEK